MIGTPRVHHRVADSTNQRAKELAAGGAPSGTVVTAGEQTAGRGRQGRAWVAPPGTALLMSVVVRELSETAPLLPLASAVAVCEAAEGLVSGVRCAIKWPNDVWIERRKACGILVEGRPSEDWAVIGIGLNVSTAAGDFPRELRDSATSLAAASGTPPPSLEDAFAATAAALDRWLAAPAAHLLDAWRSRDALRGERVGWNGGEGVAAGIDATGSLVVERPGGGRTTLDAGEVHLDPPHMSD